MRDAMSNAIEIALERIPERFNPDKYVVVYLPKTEAKAVKFMARLTHEILTYDGDVRVLFQVVDDDEAERIMFPKEEG